LNHLNEHPLSTHCHWAIKNPKLEFEAFHKRSRFFRKDWMNISQVRMRPAFHSMDSRR
jgi:hypothetical protein